MHDPCFETTRACPPGILLMAALFLALLPGCSDDADKGGSETDTLQVDTAPACACAEGCPAGLCDVRVTLESSCRGKVDEATVTIDGVALGTVTTDAPWVSCETWSCDATVQLSVDGTNFSTGIKTIAVLLDPDVPIGCDNL